MIIKLKSISKRGIPAALVKAERYRLLNDPSEAESICRDVLGIDPKNQKALVALILSLTDQFDKSLSDEQPLELVAQLKNGYDRAYYGGIVVERKGKALLHRGTPGSRHAAYECYREAMAQFEKAEKLRPAGNDASILRWNACVRTIQDHKLSARDEEKAEPATD